MGIGSGDVATYLARVLIRGAGERKYRHRYIAGLFFEYGIINGLTIYARRRPGL